MASATVTVLFTDLVGSTALLSRVGEERAEALRREHFALLRAAIVASGGREVKNLGDGLMVVVASAADGVAGAVAIQQAFERRNRDASEPLSVRVGVSVGDADVEDADYFGVPVVEAARLCARADGGEILVTELVRALAGSRGGFEFVSLGGLELKGLDGPVGACRVEWTPHVAERLAIPLPGRVASASSAVFVGRARERQRIVESSKAAAGGARRIVLLSGDPGIGKTSLAAAVARDAFEQGAVVAYGRCDEDLGIPYQPWAEALAHLVRHLPEAVLAAHVDARGRALAHLVPAIAARAESPTTASGDGESARYLLFGAVVDVFSRASSLAPVVLLLDDLQWADRQTIQLLRHLVAAEPTLPLLVIATFRGSDVGPDHPLAEALAALHRESGVERLALRGLGDDELLTLLETTAGHEMTADGVALRDALSAETEGNPFFVGEMLRHLAETRAIAYDDEGRWVARADLRMSGLPISVREVIGRRVARLGAPTKAMLCLGSVIGREFDLPLLARVADLDEDTALDLCDAAVTAAVLIEAEVPGRYAFAHGLIEHSLYEDLSAGRRARAHQLIAETLEELCGADPGERIGELAYHWSRATRPHDGGIAISYAQRAGDRALAQLAPDEAVRWYRDALDLLDRADQDDPVRRATLLVGLGVAQRQTGDPEHRATLLAAARLADRFDAVDILVQAVLGNSRGFSSIVGAVDHERLEVLTRALARLGADDSPDRARLLALLCAERMYDTDFRDRLSLATDAVDMARRVVDKAALVDAIRLCLESITMPETLELRRRWSMEACVLADELDEPIARLWANLYRALVALAAGDLATVRVGVAVFESECERVGQPLSRWQVTYHGAWQRLLEGDLVAAEQHATEALTLGTAAGHPDAVTIYGAQLLNLRRMQGRLGEMIPLIEQAAIDNPGLPVFRAALVAAKCSDDRDDEVRQLLDTEVVNEFPIHADGTWSVAHVLWTLAATRTGHRPAATALYERLVPWSDQFVTTHISVDGSVAHCLGLLAHTLGRLNEADQWFTRALAVHERLEAPFFIALTETAWAALLCDRDQPGDAVRARALVAAAFPVATARGYGDVARDARVLLDRLDRLE